MRFFCFEYRKCEKGLLRSDGQIGFSTEIGRAKIYSMVFHHTSWFGLDSLPSYVELVEGPLGPVGGLCSALFYFEQRQIPKLHAALLGTVFRVWRAKAAKKFDGYRKVLVPIKEM